MLSYFDRRRQRKEVARLVTLLPADLHETLNLAFAGDYDSARILATAVSMLAPNPLAGEILVSAYRSNVKNPAYRAMTEIIWLQQHDAVAQAVKHNQDLARDVLKRASFDVSTLPDTIDVFRGVLSFSSQKSNNGISWTTDRDLACWFAMRFPIWPNPAVLKATVSRSDIIFYSNARAENEIVTACEPIFCIDGDKSEWASSAQRHIAKRRAVNKLN